jgi:hypothetical protein
MTSHVGRLYALAIALLVFFITWTAVAAQPWATSTASDPRLQAIAAREQQVRAESVAVRRLVNQRWAVYRKQLKVRQGQIAAAKHAQLIAAPAPSVRVVTLPPLTITRTS